MLKQLIILGLISLSSVAQAQDKVQQLLERIEALEKQQQDMLVENSQQPPRLNSFFRNNLTMGGFFEPAITHISGSDTKSQTASIANTLGLNISAQLSPKMRFVTQLLSGFGFNLENQHNNPEATSLGQTESRTYTTPNFGAVVAQGYVEYSLDSNMQVQTGIGYLPFGYAFQQRELVLFVRRGGPQLIRTNDIVSPLWNGVHLLGRFPNESKNLGYNLYTFTNLSDPRSPGIGGRVWMSAANDRITTGLSTQVGKKFGEDFQTVGYDYRWTPDFGILTAEVAKQFTEGDDPWTAYLEPSFYVYEDQLLVYTFADFVDASKNMTGPRSRNLKDPFRKWEFGAGLNWLPNSYVRYRAGFTLHDYVGGRAVVKGQDRDFVSVDFSVGVAF